MKLRYRMKITVLAGWPTVRMVTCPCDYTFPSTATAAQDAAIMHAALCPTFNNLNRSR